MRELWPKVLDALALLLGVTIIGLVIIALILFMPFVLIYAHFSDKYFKKKYALYLKEMDGARFFCYNNRRSSIAFAEENIVPALDPAIRIVFVEGTAISCGSDSKFISEMLYGIKERRGFPYLLKIEASRIIDASVNNQFYSIMVGQKPIKPLIENINAFFSVREGSESS
jgi:hypothetical protein